jgi:phosphoribosylpyrophosphate synthetase
MAHPSVSHIAEQLKRSNPETYEMVNVNWKQFESGMPNIFIPEVHCLQGRDVLLIGNIRQKDILLDQMALIYALPQYGCQSLTVCLPFFPTGTIERQTTEVGTAATLSRLLSATPLTTTGPVKFVFFDIHALQIRFYFQDSILPVLLTAMPLLSSLMRSRYKDEKVAIAFPTEAAKKRFGGFFAKEGYPILFCLKVTEGDRSIIRVEEGDAKDCHVIIVDDMCNTGETLLACRDALRKEGPARISAYVTHGLFPLDSWRKLERAGFHKIFITDSIPQTVVAFEQHNATHGKASPFEVIGLAPLLHQYLITE